MNETSCCREGRSILSAYTRNSGGSLKTWAVALSTFVVGLVLTPLLVFLYLDFGRPPVAVADKSFPFEKKIVRMPLHRRIDSEMEQSPIAATPAGLMEGAHTYQQHCAFCHGLPSHPSAEGKAMFPTAPQLWQSHRPGVTGVSDDPVGETYWRVKNGIRLSGMPSYQGRLTEQQMWQVSLLLASANQPLTDDLRSALQAN